MGIPGEVFWTIVEVVEVVLPEVDRDRLERPGPKRQAGAGRSERLPEGSTGLDFSPCVSEESFQTCTSALNSVQCN